MHGQPPGVRGAEPWPAVRAERWPVARRAESPPVGLTVEPWRADLPVMLPSARVTGHLCRQAAGIDHLPTGGVLGLRWPPAPRSDS